MYIKAKLYQEGEFKDDIEANQLMIASNDRCIIAGNINYEDVMRLTTNAMASAFKMYNELEKEDGYKPTSIMNFISMVAYNSYLIATNKQIADCYKEFKVDNKDYKVDTDAYLAQMIESQLKDLFDKLDNEETDDN